MLFELFYVGFGQFIAAMSPNELLASLLVPCFFTFIVAFCGVVVPYMALPTFWRSWMYWLTPFHYLLEGFLGVVVHDIPMECVQREESFFSIPPGFGTCQEYAGAFVDAATGYVRDAGGGMCAYCQFRNGDQFVRLSPLLLHYILHLNPIYNENGLLICFWQATNFNVYYSNKWRDYGIFWAFVAFNFAAVFFFSWLYLHGVNDAKRWVSARRTRKSVKS